MKDNRKFVLRNNIKIFRKYCHFSQQKLASLCGVSRNTISSLENYTYTPSAYLSGILCMSLGCKWEELFFYEEIK